MADDLIIKYFQEDLTEAEDQRLREILSSSVEESWRFFQHAETAYHQYGLPEPRWPKGDPPSSWMHFSLWVWPILLATALGSLGWAFFHVISTAPATAMAPIPQEERKDRIPSSRRLQVKKDVPHTPEGQEVSSDEPTQAEKNGTTPSRLDPPELLSQGNAPSFTPVVPSPRGHRTHSNLEVVVHRSRPTPLAVEVLGPDGKPVVLLYQGTVQPGTWAFDWDGKLADGQKPPPGTYRIAVESSAVTQVKKVVIH